MRIHIPTHDFMSDISCQRLGIPSLSRGTMDHFRESIYWRAPGQMATHGSQLASTNLQGIYENWLARQPADSLEPVQLAFWILDEVRDAPQFTDNLVVKTLARTIELGRHNPVRTAQFLVKELSMNDGLKDFLDSMADIGSDLADRVCDEQPLLAAALTEVTGHVRLCTGAPDDARDIATFRKAFRVQAEQGDQDMLWRLMLSAEYRGGANLYSPRSFDALDMLNAIYDLHPCLMDRLEQIYIYKKLKPLPDLAPAFK